MPTPKSFVPDAPSSFVEDTPSSSSDFTSNPKGEGLYRMLIPSQQGYTDMYAEIKVPFSRVNDAQSRGYRLVYPDEVSRYQKDFSHQGEGPTLLEKAKSGFAAMTAPIPDAPMEWHQPGGHTAGGFVRSLPAALTNVGNMVPNTINAAARGVAGMGQLPSYVGETLEMIHNGDPQGIDNLYTFTPPGMAQVLLKQYEDDSEKDGVDQALSNLTGNLLAMKVAGKLIEKSPEVVGRVTAKLKETAANARDAAVRGATGTGPKVVADYVAKTARDNEGAIKEAGEKTAVKQERVDEINKRRSEADAEKAKKVAEQNKATEERVKGINERRSAADKARIEKAKSANNAALKAHNDEVAAADKKMRDAHIKYLAEKSEIERANQEAGSVPRANEETSALVKDRTEEMDVRTESAAHDSLDKAEKMFKPLREKLGPKLGDPERIGKALVNAANQVDLAHPATSILKDMVVRLKGSSNIVSKLKIGDWEIEDGEMGESEEGNNKAFTYANEQSFFSRIGAELNKGTLPGVIYTAYKNLQKAIGEDMQRIADDNDMSREQSEARDYWKRQRQAFGKSSDADTSRAEKEIAEDNPDYSKEQVRDFRRRLLGFFDPAIPKLAAEIDEATGKLKAKASETVKPVPSAPESIVVNPPATKPVPEPRQPIQAPQPKPVPEPRQPLSVKPVQADVKVVTPETLTQVKADAAIDKALSVQHSPGHIATVFLALDAIRRVFHGDIGGLGIDVGARGVYALGKNAYAKILMNPKVINAVSNLTAEDVAQAMRLPESQRSGFVEVVRQANGQGIKVDPKVLAIIGASAATPRGPKYQELQKTADEYRQNSTQQ